MLLPFIGFIAHAHQNAAYSLYNADSLKIEIHKNGITGEDLPQISQLQRIYQTKNIDSAFYFSDLEIALASQINDQNALAQARIHKAQLYWNKIEPLPAKQILSKNIDNEASISDTLLAQTYMMLAKVDIQLKLPHHSLEHMIAASKIYMNRNDSSNVVSCFSYIGGIHLFIMQDEERAIEYFEQSITYNDHKKEYQLIPLYINYSTALSGLDRFDAAISKVEMAENLAKKLGVTQYDASIYVQYALVYNTSGKYRTSLKYTQIADSIIKTNATPELRTREKVRWYYALNYKALEQYDQAIHYFKLLEKSLLLDPWDATSNLIDIYEIQGNYENAFYAQERLIAAKDSVNEVARAEKLKEVIEKYENEQKQQQIAALSVEKALQQQQIDQQRFILYGIVTFFLCLIGFGLYWYGNRIKLKTTRQNLETAQLQQRFLRTQLNPHFFFHALTSIESYIYENNKEEAAFFMQRFSLLMRNILEFSDMDFISLKNDIDFIQKYLELQQLNHEFAFEFEITTAESLDVDNLLIPPMLIQPDVENAILHGALSRKNGKVNIDYSCKDNQLIISIQDNGHTGVSRAKNAGKLHRSMSTSITKKRIKNFREVHDLDIQYHPIEDQVEKSEKVVVFTLPFKRSS